MAVKMKKPWNHCDSKAFLLAEKEGFEEYKLIFEGLICLKKLHIFISADFYLIQK